MLTKSWTQRLTAALLFLAATAPGNALAGDKDDFASLISAATDTAAPLPDREKALSNAMQGAHVTKGGSETLGHAIQQILKELEKKKSDPAPSSLVQIAFRAIDSCPSFTPTDVGNSAKGYLSKDTDSNMRMAALAAIEAHGANGISADLLAIFSEGDKSKAHDSVETHALNACMGMSGGDAEKLVKDILKTTKSKVVRTHAIGAMGDLVTKRSMSDLDPDLAVKTLMEFASATYPDADIACAAALAIFHWGSWDGVGQLVERAKAERRGPPREVYKTICFVAHKLPAGFANVAPDAYLTSPQKSEATGEMYLWWDSAKAVKPEAGLFDALKTAGIAVPKDTSVNSKEAIGTLLSGLELPNRALRYQCFDMLVKRLGPSDFSKTFKRLVMRMGKNSTEENEPAVGFTEGSEQADKLFELQKERAKKWRAWWDQNSGKASLVGGVWKVS